MAKQSAPGIKEQVDKLRAQVGQEEETELVILYNALVKNTNEYSADSSITNLKNWQAAKTALADCIADLQAKYQPASAQPGTEFEPTRKAIEVFRWLTANGWQISQRQFYDHVKEGKLPRDGSGKFTVRRAQKYARTFLRRTETGKTLAEDDSALAREKLQAEIKLKQTQERRESHRLSVEQGKYLPRDEVETMLAARAAILDADFEHLAYTKAPELVALVGGDPSRTDQLLQALLSARDEWLNRYATTREFDVEFQPPAPEAAG